MTDITHILQLVVLTGAAITGLYIIARALRKLGAFVAASVRGCVELQRKFNLVYETVSNEMHPNCGGSMKDLIESFVARFELIEAQLTLLAADAIGRRDNQDASALSDSSPAANETE